MITKVLNWLGLGDIDGHSHGGHGHANHGAGEHGHKHGVIDPSLTTTEQGIWAIKWSFVILAITAAFQLAIVFVSGSVALLADTIHNIGDATTAIPLWVAFMLARRKPSKTFSYGLGRAEDLAGILIVLIIPVQRDRGWVPGDRAPHKSAAGPASRLAYRRWHHRLFGQRDRRRLPHPGGASDEQHRLDRRRLPRAHRRPDFPRSRARRRRRMARLPPWPIRLSV